jgi:ribosome biogenesis GTPase
MREIQLADCKEGIAVTFSDIEELAYQCRYRDCQHQNEPGCAVQQAISEGKIEQRRLESYTKLIREEALNTATIAEKRSKEKALGKFYKRTMKESRKLRGLE